MSGTAPTPGLFGSDEAAQAANPRSEDQMAPSNAQSWWGEPARREPDQGAVGSYAQGWWQNAPERTTLATTTGQNTGGVRNAFDTDWWESANRQDREQTTLLGRWSRPDADGIATYSFGQDEVARPGMEKEVVKFGDVFSSGQKVGNIYEGYGGMTATDADEIMARLILPREVWAAAYETEAGKPLTFTGNLSDEIQRAATLRTQDFTKGLTAAAFEEGVSERAAGMEESGAWQTGNVAAGIAGGTATGAGVAGVLTAATGGAAAPLAPFIIGLSALAGGAGAWLNRDEQFRVYAQALEQQELAAADGHNAVGYLDAAAGFTGAAMSTMNVSRNLLHGAYDAANGEIGDQSSAYQDSETPLWMQAADMASLLVDGIGSFGSQAARRTFTTLMGTSSAAQQASLIASGLDGNVSFNPYSGTYEDIGAGGMAQRQLSVGIDIAQTAAAGMLGRVINRTTAGRFGNGMSTGGHVISTVGGQQSARLGFSALIPSEAAVGATARMMARRSLVNSGERVTRESLAVQTARQLEMLTTGRKTIATAVVNGFGEGAEEFVQAVLGATAYGEVPTFRELVEASKQGFAMGAGMGSAVSAGGRDRGQVYMERANVMRALRGQQEWSTDEWSKLTDSERAMQGTVSDAREQKLYDLTVRELVKQSSGRAAATFVEIRRAMEVARTIAEREMKNSQTTIESSRLSLRSNYEWAPQDFVVSLEAAARDITARIQTMQQRAADLTPEERAMVARIAQADTVLLGQLQQLDQVIKAAAEAGDLDGATQAIEVFNQMLRGWWNAADVDETGAVDESAFGRRRSASVWGARFPLNSAGSLQLLRLQISPELTFAGTHNAALVPDEIQAPMGGDFDGDRIINMIRQLLPEESFQALRFGAGQLTADGTMLSAKPYVIAALETMAAARVEPSSEAFGASTAALGKIRRRLNKALAQSTIPADVRKKLVADFANQLAANNPRALKTLFDTLATGHAPAMRELGPLLGGSPYLLMNRIVEDELRVFMNAAALRTGARTFTGRVDLPETSKNMPRKTGNRVRQPSEIADAAAITGSYDMFRLQQILKYNARREAIETTPEDTADVLAEFYRTFTARNDGLVRPGEQAIFETTKAQERTIAWLEGLADDYRKELGNHTRYEALVLLAGQRVADVDTGSRAIRANSRGDITVVQAILRQVVVGLRSEYAELMGDTSIKQRLASLDALTNPDFMDGDQTHAQGGEAFVEVLGAFPVTDLIGEQGAALSSYTVRQLRDYLVSLRWDAREAFVDALQKHPSYANVEGETTTPYRTLVDLVTESARMRLSEDRDTGEVRGTLTRPSRTASRNFMDLHDKTRAVAHNRGYAMKSAADVRSFLASDPRLGEAIMRLVEERGVVAGTVQRNADGEISSIEFPQWIYDVFAEPRSAKAEMRLLEQTLIYAKAGLQTLDEDGNPTDQLDPHRVNDRVLRLWLDLDYRANARTSDSVHASVARDEFLRLLTESESTDEFIRGLNQDYRFRDERSAPFMAWARDRSFVEADRYGRGISDVQEGVEMRDALRDAAATAATVLNDDETVREYLSANADLLSRLRESRDGVGDELLWTRFKAWFEIAKDLPTMVGASVWIQQAGHINEILSNMGIKGTSPENVEALGKSIAAQLPTFDAAAGRLIASMTSGSMGAILSDMTMLARGSRTIVMNDGTVVDWNGVNAEQAVDLLADPTTAGLASRMLGMTAWDYNSDLGQNVLVSIVGQGVAGFTANPADSLFGSDTASQFRRLMVLESMSTTPGGAPIIPVLLAQLMNVREAAVDHVLSDRATENGTERERMAVTELSRIASALDKLSRIEGLYERTSESNLVVVNDDGEPAANQLPGTGVDVTLIHRTLLRAGRKARSAKGVGSTVAHLLPAEPGPLQDVMHEVLRQWSARFAASAVASGDKYLKAAAKRIKKDLSAIDDFTSPLDVLLDTYGRYDDPLTQQLLLSHAREYGDLATSAAWARDVVLKAQRPGTPQLKLSEWEDLARAVIAYTMHTTYGVATRSELEISKFPSLSNVSELEHQRSFWDPTFVEPGLDIFAPGILRDPTASLTPLLMSQLELSRAMGPQLKTVTADQAEAAVYELIAPLRVEDNGKRTGSTGQWHALVPALMHSAVGAVLASAAASAISMAGINPERLRMLTATTLQDWARRPADTELSTATIDAAQLTTAVEQGSELDSPVLMQIAGRQGPTERRLAQLEGRVVRSVTVTLPGQAPISLLGNPRYSSGLLLPEKTGVAAGEGGVINLTTLAGAVSTLLDESGITGSQYGQVTVDISFFHPETKAISATREAGSNYDHNPWFDGVGASTDAAYSQPSLLGSFFFGLSGTIPAAYNTALDAIKKLTFALQQVTDMPEAYRAGLVTGGTTDMALMLQRMTEFALKQKVDGRTLGLRNYNAIHKLLSLMYVVRYTDADGAHVISAEETIARQMRGEQFTPDQHAQTVGLPLQHVLALMGELDLASQNMVVTPWGERLFSPDVSRAVQYTKFPAHAWSNQMLGGFTAVETDDTGAITGWATKDLLAEPQLLSQTLPRATVRNRNGIAPRGRFDFYGPYRKHQEKVYADRAGDSRSQTHWAELKAKARSLAVLQENIGQSVLASVQLSAEGFPLEAAQLLAPKGIGVSATNDLSTGWTYQHLGEKRGGIYHGMLTKPAEIAGNTTVDDDVYVYAETFYQGERSSAIEKVLPEAQEVLRELMAVGATVHLPGKGPIGGELRRAMATYLKSNDYIETELGSYTFVPRPKAEQTQAAAAFRSMMSGATHRTSRNRVVVEYSANTVVNENSIYGVNGGFTQLGSYDTREAVQTARYAGYAPATSPVNNQRQHLSTVLLDVLNSQAGVDYLRTQSGIDPTDKEAEAELQRALADLKGRLIYARSNPSASLVPDAGAEFGTGDIIPLVSYNERGELVGIHLLRHGHAPVDEKVIRGAALPEGNAALGVDGVRLTIDKGKVDALHTTHRGELVERAWLGLQGFVARVRVDLDSLGTKIFESGTGMKWTITSTPSDLLIPKRAIFAGRPVLGAADIASPASKSADGYWLNVASRIVETVGFDVMPRIVRLLTGVEYDPATPSQYFTAEETVRNALHRFRSLHGGSVDASAIIARRTDAFAGVLRGQLMERFNEVLDGLTVDLNDLSTSDRLADITLTQMVLSSLAAGADLDEVMGAPGYIGMPVGSTSHTMHPVFTTLMDQLAHDHPARQAFVDQINSRMMSEQDTEGYQLLPNFTWIRHVQDEQGNRYEVPAMLAFPELRATDTNDVLSEQGADRRQRASISPTTQAMVFSVWGASPVLARGFKGGREVFEPNQFIHGGEDGAKALIFGSQAGASPFVPRMDDDLVLTAQEHNHVFVKALPSRQALSVPISDSGWYESMSREKVRTNRQAYEKAFTRTLYALRLKPTDSLYLTEMLRSVVARPATAKGEDEYMTYREAMAGLKLILTNAERGDMPTHGGAVNVVSRAALNRLREVGYPLTAGNGSKRPLGAWDEWVDAMLSEAFSDATGMRGYPAVTNIVDGLLYEYRKDVKGLPATTNSRLASTLALVRSHSGMIVASPILRNAFDNPIVQEGLAVEPAELTTAEWMLEELPQTARAIVEARMTTWEAGRGLRRKRQSPRAEARRGAQVREDLARSNVVMRYVQLGYVLKTMLNPGLHIGAFIELGIKGGQENMVSFLSGESLGHQGFTKEQRQLWHDTVERLADSPQFYSLVYRNTNYQQLQGADSKTEAWLQHKANRLTGAINDPTWGTRAKVLANTFLEAAWDSASKFSVDRNITIERFLEIAGVNVESLAEISADAVAHGFSRIEYRRNLQDNLLEIMRRRAVEGVIGSGVLGMNALGVLLLRMPTMFFRFRSNTIINMFGLQAPHAVITQLLSDRTRRPGGLKSRIAGLEDGVDVEVSAQARIEDSYDLTRAIIRSGVSHSQLMILGMVLSSLGFGGDDEEEKLLNKLRRYQKPMVAKDPMALENDFRNAEAWFSDLLPAGMGVPSWLIRPFVSPAMGVARFFETGDIRQVYYGFADALGNMPLLNVDTVQNSWMLANELTTAAEAESQDESIEASSRASVLMWTALGTLESMLFESSFASMVYQAADEYDRDPYKIPLVDSAGTVQVDALGNPRPTNALTDFVDPETGLVRQGYLNRNDVDAFLHGLGENRPIFAHVASLIMNDSSFIRTNMVPKTREVDSDELTQEEAGQIVMSVFNNEAGGEELTLDGAAATVRGVHLGTVSLDDPALTGIFIPEEMRFALTEQFLGELTQKYLDLRFSKSEALSRAKEEFYGQAYGAPEGLGLADIIWSDRIPAYQTQRYYQLNTTYVMGPGGYPIATGLQRSVLTGMGLNVSGLGLFETFHDGTTGNLGVDPLLNSIDVLRGVNLGQRGLVKVDESWLPPTQEEIANQIESAIDRIGEKIDDLNDNMAGGYGSGYGYGGGSGGYTSRADYGGMAQRLNTPRTIGTPYALSPRVVNTSNPTLRRATIRRERISSERGRLNQWQ
jgi:hypothetical protein